jgi:hypothetical protein
VTAAIEVRVDDPAAELPTVRPALVIAGRSLTRELSAASEVNGRGPGLRPHPHPGAVASRAVRGAVPAATGAIQKLRQTGTAPARGR